MRIALSILMLGLLAACSPPGAKSQADAAGAHAAAAASDDNAPEETDPPNATGQHPAFPGQTRAPALHANVAFRVATIARGLDHPWGEAFLPDGRLLVTERVGRLRIIGKDGRLSAPASGVPATVQGEQAGLFGLALDPKFKTNGLV